MSSWPSRSHFRDRLARATASGNGSTRRTSWVTPPARDRRALLLSSAERGFSAAHRAVSCPRGSLASTARSDNFIAAALLSPRFEPMRNPLRVGWPARPAGSRHTVSGNPGREESNHVAGASAPPVLVESGRVGESKGPRPAGRKTVGPGGGRHALGLRSGQAAHAQPPDQPLRRLRFVRTAAPGRLPRSAPYPPRLLPDAVPRRSLPYFYRYRRFDLQGGSGGNDGNSGVHRPFRRDRLAPGRHRVDGGTPDLRPPSGCGPTGLSHRPTSRRLGAGGRLLHLSL